MVAKNIWLIFVSLVFVLTACQTITPTVDSEPVLTTNQPEDVEKASKTQAEATANDDSTDTVVTDSPRQGKAGEQVQSESTKGKTDSTPLNDSPKSSPEQVVTRLQQEALQLQSEGRWPEAELKLERALRIDAEKVDLYHQLATVRMGQERFDEAEQIALKGLSLTDQTPKYKASLWEVIAQCRSAMGDIQAARKARTEMLKWMDD